MADIVKEIQLGSVDYSKIVTEEDIVNEAKRLLPDAARNYAAAVAEAMWIGLEPLMGRSQKGSFIREQTDSLSCGKDIRAQVEDCIIAKLREEKANFNNDNADRKSVDVNNREEVIEGSSEKKQAMKSIDCQKLELRSSSGTRIAQIVAASVGEETLDPAGAFIPVLVTIDAVVKVDPGDWLTVWNTANDCLTFNFQITAVEMQFLTGQTVIEGENFITN